jgi:hypothetical protein
MLHNTEKDAGTQTIYRVKDMSILPKQNNVKAHGLSPHTEMKTPYHCNASFSFGGLDITCTKIFDKLSCIYLHGTFFLAHAICSTSLFAIILVDLLESSQPMGPNKELVRIA